MNRRGFLATSLAACAAPAFVKSDSLMGLWVPRRMNVTLRETLRLPSSVSIALNGRSVSHIEYNPVLGILGIADYHGEIIDHRIASEDRAFSVIEDS